MFLQAATFATALAVILVNVSCLPYHGSEHVQMNAEIGSRVDLTCSFAPHERGSISWRVDGELIAIGSSKLTRNPRIHLTGHGTITIHPVQREDIKTYVCSTGDASQEQKFLLRQAGSSGSHLPSMPYVTSPQTGDCNAVDRLERKIDIVSERIERFSQQIYAMETKLTYVSGGPGRTPEVKRWPERATTTTTTTTTYRPPVDSLRRDTPETRQIYVSGKRVNEYTWIIDRFDNEYHEAEYEGRHVLRTFFLTSIPGYNMSVRLYPNKDRQGYLSIYAEPAVGVYDHLMPWPFRMNYELAIVSHYSGVNDIVAGTIRPLEGKCPSEAFTRRHSQYDGIACGYSKFMAASEYREHKYAYLKSGRLHLRIRLSDP